MKSIQFVDILFKRQSSPPFGQRIDSHALLCIPFPMVIIDNAGSSLGESIINDDSEIRQLLSFTFEAQCILSTSENYTSPSFVNLLLFIIIYRLHLFLFIFFSIFLIVHNNAVCFFVFLRYV